MLMIIIITDNSCLNNRHPIQIIPKIQGIFISKFQDLLLLKMLKIMTYNNLYSKTFQVFLIDVKVRLMSNMNLMKNLNSETATGNFIIRNKEIWET